MCEKRAVTTTSVLCYTSSRYTPPLFRGTASATRSFGIASGQYGQDTPFISSAKAIPLGSFTSVLQFGQFTLIGVALQHLHGLLDVSLMPRLSIFVPFIVDPFENGVSSVDRLLLALV